MEAKLQCAAIVDLGTQFVPPLYRLEGDGFTFLDVYDALFAIEAWWRHPALVQCDALNAAHVAKLYEPQGTHARKVREDELSARMKKYCINVILPGKDGFKRRFGNIEDADGGELSDLVRLYKHARLLNPFSVWSMSPTEDSIHALAKCFPLLHPDSERKARLIVELPTYLAVCQPLRLPPKPDTVTTLQHRDTCIARVFANNVANIPEFCALFRDLALVTASSAAAERVFSLYNNTFGDQQDNAKEDYIEASMMAQYRQREPNWGSAE